VTDPESASRKGISDGTLLALLAVITAAGPVTMNIYLPALPRVQAHFGIPVSEANATVSLALIAFAIGVFVFGPLSDRFGRRPIVLVGQAIFAAGNLLCLLSPSFEGLLAGRIVQALGPSAGLVVARAVLGDLYGREKMARMLAYLTMIIVIGPTVAPLVGGLITESLGWQSIFAFLLAANMLIFFLAWRHLPETRSIADRGGGAAELARAALAMVRQRAFLGFTIQSGVIYAVFLTFISIAPYVMVSLGHSSTEYGLWYLAVAIGYFLGNWVVTRYATRVGLQRLISAGITVQLASAIGGAALVLTGFWQPAAIFIPMGVLGFGQGLALPNITASAVALAPRTAGAASSMLSFAQQLIGAIAVQGMAMFATDTPVPIYLFTVVVSLAAWLSLFALPRAHDQTRQSQKV
jgi:DHA1 family bicyclomycin/chloramphenicol resistance-like MFS transporter